MNQGAFVDGTEVVSINMNKNKEIIMNNNLQICKIQTSSCQMSE